MRIAFFTEAYDPFINGVVVLVKHFRQELLDRGHEVTVFTPAYPGQVDADPGVVRIPSVYWSSVAYPCVRPWCHAQRCFDGQFDLVHSHHPFSTGWLAERVAQRYGLPLIYTFHTLLTNYTAYVPLPPTMAERLLWSIVHRHLAHAGRITVSTPVMRRFLHAHDVLPPVSLVTPTHHLPAPTPGAREAMRARLGVPDGVPLLLYAGRLAHEKCVTFLLRAAAAIDTRRDWRLVLLGDGPLHPELPGLAASLGIGERVQFPGVVPHEAMADWYAAADIFVFPSKNETYGLVLLEAMSAGLPAVAINQNGPLDIIEHGRSGLLSPFAERAYAAAVERLLGSAELRASIGAGARRRAARLTAVPTGEQLLHAYRALLDGRTGDDDG